MEIKHYHPFRSPEAKAAFLASYDARANLWPIPSEPITIPTAYGPTFVRISGPADSPAMVLLHGHSENGLNWLPNIETLSQDYRTYAVDIITDPGRSIYTKILRSADDFSDWLDQLLDRLGLTSRIHLVGVSYGGWLAGQYTLRFPHRINKLVLIAPAGIAPFPLKFISFALFLSLFQFRSRVLFKGLTRWMFKDFLANPDLGEDAFNTWFDFIYLGLQSHQPQPIVFAKVLTDQDLQAFPRPTLFLTGENEIIYAVPKTLERLRTVAPNIVIKVIEQAGHDLPLAQPQQVNHAILEFLQFP